MGKVVFSIALALARSLALALSLSFLSLPLPAQAQDLSLRNIDEADFKNLIQDFSGNFNHTSVSGASSLGNIFGFEFGLIGGVADAKKIQKIVSENNVSADVDPLIHAALLGMLTVPFGITVEGAYFPKVGSDEFKYGQYSLAAKWTLTDLIEMPLSLAAKVHTTITEIQAQASINGVPTKYNYDNSILGLTFLASKNLGLFEPYIGFGFLSANGELSATGSTQVFDTSFTASQNVRANQKSTTVMVGGELKLVFFKLGVEYSRLFDTNRFTGKLSFYF